METTPGCRRSLQRYEDDSSRASTIEAALALPSTDSVYVVIDLKRLQCGSRIH